MIQKFTYEGLCTTKSHMNTTSYKSMSQGSDFQPFPSHGTHKLITKILRLTKKIYYFADLTKNLGVISIHPHCTAIVVLAVIMFFT